MKCDFCNKDYTKNIYSLGEYNEHCICEKCYIKLSNKVNRYNYKPNFDFKGSKDRKKHLHIGVELELQASDNWNFCLFLKQFRKNKNIYMKRDGSLNNWGIEFVSMPMTYYYLNHNSFKKLFESLNKYQFNNINHCGLHFHIDRQYLDTADTAKIDYIVNNWTNILSEIGGREFNSYCITIYKHQDEYGKPINFNRYLACNLLNADTIELRFCASTYDYNTFIKRITLIFSIVDISKQYTFKQLMETNNYEEIINEHMRKYLKSF